MDRKTRLMLCIGTACAGVSASLMFAPPGSDRSFWATTAILGSASFAYFAFAFGTVRWATVSVSLYVATMGGIVFFASHHGEPLAVLGLIAVVAANGIVGWTRWKATVAGVIVLVAGAVTLSAQAPAPEFDVASVKPAMPNRPLGEVINALRRQPPGQWRTDARVRRVRRAPDDRRARAPGM